MKRVVPFTMIAIIAMASPAFGDSGGNTDRREAARPVPGSEKYCLLLEQAAARQGRLKPALEPAGSRSNKGRQQASEYKEPQPPREGSGALVEAESSPAISLGQRGDFATAFLPPGWPDPAKIALRIFQGLVHGRLPAVVLHDIPLWHDNLSPSSWEVLRYKEVMHERLMGLLEEDVRKNKRCPHAVISMAAIAKARGDDSYSARFASLCAGSLALKGPIHGKGIELEELDDELLANLINIGLAPRYRELARRRLVGLAWYASMAPRLAWVKAYAMAQALVGENEPVEPADLAALSRAIRASKARGFDGLSSALDVLSWEAHERRVITSQGHYLVVEMEAPPHMRKAPPEEPNPWRSRDPMGQPISEDLRSPLILPTVSPVSDDGLGS